MIEGPLAADRLARTVRIDPAQVDAACGAVEIVRLAAEVLAQEAALSRSSFAERFTEFVGQPPMQYLTNWRMQLASNHLRAGVEPITAIAHKVGYESEAAFSRAFKKAVGAPPGEWREQHVRFV